MRGHFFAHVKPIYHMTIMTPLVRCHDTYRRSIGMMARHASRTGLFRDVHVNDDDTSKQILCIKSSTVRVFNNILIPESSNI